MLITAMNVYCEPHDHLPFCGQRTSKITYSLPKEGNTHLAVFLQHLYSQLLHYYRLYKSPTALWFTK